MLFIGKNVNLRFVLFCILIVAVFTIGCFGSESSKSYDVNIPEEWKKDISVGELTIDHNAFYGVPWFLGLFPVVRLQLPVENLTYQTLYFRIHFRTEGKKRGYGNSGMGALYELKQREKRLIDTIAPIGSATIPICFKLGMSEPFDDPDDNVSTKTKVVIIDPFEISATHIEDVELKNIKNGFFEIKNVRLMYSEEKGNHVVFEVRNKTNSDQRIESYVAVNDPEDIESKGPLERPRGFFSDSIKIIPANKTISITIPYHIPHIGPKPVLVYTLFKPNQDLEPGERDHRKWDMVLAGYGSFDLLRAAERGQCVIPVRLPVEERIKLTAYKETEHFLFRYRPSSYAEKHLDRAISEREAAYQRLCVALKIELPVRVTIDLYPDMEAKGLGSGTTWTPANTRNNKHICEVYNEQNQTDPHHELAHIFSYHFPGYSSNRGGIVESLAAYFEVHNMPIPETKVMLKRQLNEGKLDSLLEILQSEGSCQELVILIDFLLAKDVEKFKEFYVSVTESQEKSDIEKACRLIYGTELKDMETQWHDYINQSGDI